MAAYLMFALWSLKGGADANIPPERLELELDPVMRDAHEVLAHVFDYVHFYRRASRVYIESIWTSWAVLPFVRRKMEAYLVRTACALFSDNLSRESSLDITLEQLKTDLEKLIEKADHLPILDEAHAFLAANREAIRGKLAKRVHLIRVVSCFLSSLDVRQSLERNASPAVPGADASLVITSETRLPETAPLSFDHRPVRNPLEVLLRPRTKLSDRRRSAYILHLLAFEDDVVSG